MRVYTHIEYVWSEDLQSYVEDTAATQYYEHDGPVALCGGGKGGGGSAPAADPNIGIAALKNAEVGEEWLGFAKEQFAAGNIRQDEMDALTKQVIQQQLSTQDETNQWAREDRARTKEVFQPLEDEWIKKAKEYDSPEKQAEAAAQARADVQKTAAQQAATSERNMASMGVNPASGRFAGVSRAGEANTALASAGAQNNARQIVKDKGIALQADAINMGKGLAASTASAYGLGLNAGQGAVGSQQAANSNFYQNANVMNQGYSGAMQGYTNQANILNNLYGNNVNAWAAQQQASAQESAGFGSIIGAGMGAAATIW